MDKHNTSRRAILAGAGGIAAASALPTAALATASPGASPEFLAYRQHWLRYEELGSRGKADWDEAAWQQACGDAYDALRVLLGRPANCWQHVIELARAARMELRDEEPDGECNPEWPAILLAIEAMAVKGGANV
jgi:hypothetical protein